ncbi:uncharacterized protein C11orf24 homolog [Pteropus alecto]|uniref:uncharacterized protein C11orf24 homolog n=1 Tax=Pteropus alecto TaxID=9402 RepID=UPI000D5331B6|nr:uncharacterized protein C11orf24 homolog [Pteropus alecto]
MGPLPIRGETSLPVTLGCRLRSTTEPGEAQEPAQEHRPTEWFTEEFKIKPRPASPSKPCITDQMTSPDHRSLGQAAGHRQQLESGPLGAPGTVRPCSRLTCKMWAALVLVCISSLSLSEWYLVLSETQDNSVRKRAAGETTKSLFNETSEETSTVAPSPATLARETSVANPGPTTVTARTAPRTDVGTSAATAGAPDLTASGVPTPWAPTAQPAPSATAALSTPSSHPGATPPPAAATTANASSPMGTQSPSEHTPSHPTASPTTPRNLRTLNTPTQGPALQAASVGPVTDEPIAPSMNTPPSVASVSTTAVTATKSQAKGPAATTVPHASSTLLVGATSPTTQPSPASSSWGPTGPGTPQTPEQGQPEATSGTAPTEPTAGNSGDSKVPATDSCQLSTQGQYLVVTTRPLTLSVNRSSLLAVLLLGVTLFFTVLVLFALQAYESYRKKGYTQVDYLINGMYADSEM